jgi:geranylgeranyl pyrophosphate synthase
MASTMGGALDLFEQRLMVALADPNAEVETLLTHLAAGGKRIRPRLALASAAACADGSVPDPAIDAALAVELLHLASLYHDDVVDGATHRRGLPAVHEEWDVGRAIVGGDLLIARASRLAGRVGPAGSAAFASAFADLCEGQLFEMITQYDPTRSEAAYFASIAGKTAALFRVACELGAIGAGADAEVVRALGAFGTNLGLAFQVVDDLLDVTGSSKELGKPVGNDLRQGVYTLPVILACDSDDGVRAHLGADRGAADIDLVVRAAIEGGGIGRSADTAARHIELARASLVEVDHLDPVGLSALAELADVVVGSTIAVTEGAVASPAPAPSAYLRSDR